MPDQLPRKSKTPTQEAFETLACLWGGVVVAAFFGWRYNVPVVNPLVQQVNRALSHSRSDPPGRTRGKEDRGGEGECAV
jgi:hypothetical protein